MKTLDSPWRYQPEEGFYDEVLQPSGAIRPHWRGLTESILTLGEGGFRERWKEGQRLIHDHGITYNVYGDPQSTDRPWPLDPVPLVMDPAEWRSIEAAVAQRARLLNSILADAYGPQRLLKNRLLPAELLYPNPGFLRPCQGIAVPGGTFLHLYSADIARAPNGNWWVLADRTQAPSGAGYALENRLVCSRVLPDVFKNSNVRRLAGFFQAYRQTLTALAAHQRDNPRIVLLTPGPYNETYFEHAFLARYLGFTLVEGGDLTVRDNHVYLKTLGGLLPVDVIVRRQDAGFCDPLELRPESMLGIPGLVQAVRCGNVAIANALGSGMVESAAPSAFYPSLCRQLLGEELKMPTVATWWCGQEGPLSYVASQLHNLVVKPVFPRPGDQPIFGARLTEVERRQLVSKMRAEPGKWVAQEQVALSTVPVWEDGQLAPRHVVVRVYAVAHEGGYKVMPGGLTRVTPSLDNLVVSVQRGGGSKDTWVLGGKAEEQLTLLPPTSRRLPVSRATFDLPSRVADNLFWLGRYLERVEAMVRVIRSMLPRLTQESDATQASGLHAGARLLQHQGYIKPTSPHLEAPLLALLYDGARRGSLGHSIHLIHSVVWPMRDRISADAWRILTRLDQQFAAEPPPEPLRLSAALDLLNQTVITLAAFSGLTLESMTRGEGWRFLDIGRRLERSLQMIELLQHALAADPVVNRGELEAVLEIADSTLTYRARYQTSMQTDLVLDLLLIDEANPRALVFQLARLSEHLEQLPESRSRTRRPAEARLLLRLLTNVQLADVSDLAAPESLQPFLQRAAADLRQLSELLTRTYFNHAVTSHRLSAP
ncbi:MAG: circularly permuted type 2 ATP-grasp protein [Acidobacteria bacterium]|nr:circularly permuted type 2 ATP-grasp protein [Acidobacteriota bacterium]